MESGAVKLICVIIFRHQKHVCFGLSHLFQRQSGGAWTLGGQKAERPLQLWNANDKFTGFGLVCEAVVCQHLALGSVCVCVCVFSANSPFRALNPTIELCEN